MRSPALAASHPLRSSRVLPSAPEGHYVDNAQPDRGAVDTPTADGPQSRLRVDHAGCGSHATPAPSETGPTPRRSHGRPTGIERVG